MQTRALSLFVGFLAILVSSVHAVPNPFRLFELPATRFTVDEGGQRWANRGKLSSFGGFFPGESTPVPESVTLPAEALNRPLIHEDAWLAYLRLGPEAVANFEIVGELFTIPIGDRFYAPVAAREDARYDLGDLSNISARAIVSPTSEPLIGGFVIENQSRRVLIRCVGPSLAPYGVATPLADPYLQVYPQGSNTALLFNDDWNQRYDAAEIRTLSAQIGAFPLVEGSKDAAYLVELEPGAYTVHLTTYAGTGGTALLEIYLVP